MTCKLARKQILETLVGLAVVAGIGVCFVPMIKREQDSHKFDIPAHVTVVIEGCEYLKMHTHNNDILTHKGNCSNPIHK